jgi:hypothetical protein
MKQLKIIILEGAWWRAHESPQVLPYFQAFAVNSFAMKTVRIDLSHRTFRNADDLNYYISKIPKHAGAFLYLACHGSNLSLSPSLHGKKISMDEIVQAFNGAKPGAIDFVHFGTCEMVDSNNRRASHQTILDSAGARWVSGYTKEVEWIDSMFLELALIDSVFIRQRDSDDGRITRLKKRMEGFYKDYEQLARRLGFSAMAKVTRKNQMLPERM